MFDINFDILLFWLSIILKISELECFEEGIAFPYLFPYLSIPDVAKMWLQDVVNQFSVWKTWHNQGTEDLSNLFYENQLFHNLSAIILHL